MNEHDVKHTDSSRGVVVLVCNCSHRSEAPTLKQAREKHEAHRWIEGMRDDLPDTEGGS